MDDRERLAAVLAVKAGFIEASAARLGAALGPGLLQHLERAGAITAQRRELVLLFAAESSAAHGGAGPALRALLDPADPLPAAAPSRGLADEDDEPTRALGTRGTSAAPPAPAAGLAEEDDEPTRALGTRPQSPPPMPPLPAFDTEDEPTRALGTRPPAPPVAGLADEDDEPTRALPTRRP